MWSLTYFRCSVPYSDYANFLVFKSCLCKVYMVIAPVKQSVVHYMTQSSEQKVLRHIFVSLMKSSNCNLWQWSSSTLTRLITMWLPRSAVLWDHYVLIEDTHRATTRWKFYHESNVWIMKNLIKDRVCVWKLYVRRLAAQFCGSFSSVTLSGMGKRDWVSDLMPR